MHKSNGSNQKNQLMYKLLYTLLILSFIMYNGPFSVSPVLAQAQIPNYIDLDETQAQGELMGGTDHTQSDGSGISGDLIVRNYSDAWLTLSYSEIGGATIPTPNDVFSSVNILPPNGTVSYHGSFNKAGQEIHITAKYDNNAWLWNTSDTILKILPDGAALDSSAIVQTLTAIKDLSSIQSAVTELQAITGMANAPVHLLAAAGDLKDLATDSQKAAALQAILLKVGISVSLDKLKNVFVLPAIYDELKHIAESLVFIYVAPNGATVIFRADYQGSPRPPALPPPSCNPCLDLAQFVADNSFPAGSNLSPNQSFSKSWGVKNIGNTIWTGYNLKFLSGEQLGSPAQVTIPTTALGTTADISINLVAPSGLGTHTGIWQIVNPSGAWVSGGQLKVVINVKAQSSDISFTTDPPSPSNTSMVRIHAKVTGFSNFRSLRIKIDGSSLYEIGSPEAYWNWNTSGYSTGQHSIAVEVADQTDTSWSHPQVSSLLYTLTGTGVSNNHAPNRPLLVQNPAYDWYVTIGNAPQLCAQAQGDPDNDAITQFHFVGTASVGTIDSNWVTGPCYTFGSITPGTYTWHTQVKDSRGGISDWSDSWHFTVEPTGVSAYIDHFSTLSPSNAEQIKIYACSSGHAAVNITLRVLVNDANDGTDSGQWHIIKEQGSPCFNDTDAPVWNTLEYGDGAHLVRVVAMAIQPDAGSTSDTTYVLNHRRPNGINLVSPVPPSGNPQEAVYLNSRAITFTWNPAIRAQSYHLYVSTTLSPSTDPSPVFSQTFASTVNQYTVNFSQNYPALYWQVVAANDIGSNNSNSQAFGIDQQAPTCTVSTLASTTYFNVFQVNWTSTDTLAGIQTSDVQFMDSTRGVWVDWLTSMPFTKTYDLYNGQPGHTYFFRCRATDNAGNVGSYPGSADTSTTVDPAARPQSPWWNAGYTGKLNLTILNNMPSVALPAGYPVHLHFDSSTNPTAADVFTMSQSNPKCNDLRIVYNDTTELDRIVTHCDSTTIDFWFRTQVSISAGTSDNTSHQLYFGDASSGTPPADPNQIWYPYRESDTQYLYLFQEGSGSTAYDSSGHGKNCSIDGSVQWATSLFGNGLRFNRANSGDSRSLNCGSAIPLSSFTIEFWYRPDQDDGGKIAGELAGGGNGGGGNNWALSLMDGHIRLDTWPCAPCGSSEVHSNFNLLDSNYVNKWNHVAVSFNGGNEVKFYLNGGLDSTMYLSQSGINTYSPPLEIGSVEGINQIKANIGAFRISSGVKTSFPYGAFASITNAPTLAAGTPVNPPTSGSPSLAVLSLSTYPNPGGGVLVQAVVQNQGNLSTQSGFYTDLYLNHIPTGAGDFSNSVHFWVNDPIDAGQTTTLTTIVTDVSSLVSTAAQSRLSTQSASGITETSGTLYAQADSAGAIKEPGDQNTIYSAGTQICTSSSDSFEPDNAYTSAALISLGNSQTHNFAIPGDGDWIKFNAQAGQTYLLTTGNLDVSADTYLYLYGTDGQTLLASNDDYNNSLASQIQWTAPQSGVYYALIKGWNPNSGGCGTRYDFSLSVAGTPGVPLAATLTSPNSNIGTNYNPTYTWNQVTGSTWYQFSVDGPSGNVFSQWYTSAQANCNGTTCSVTPATTLAGGVAYTWKVMTYNSAGNGPWSTPMSFSTTGIVAPGIATLVTPIGSIGINYNPTYTWNQVTGSTWYQFSVDGPSGNGFSQWYTSAQANCNGTTCSVTPATTLAGGVAYTWKVMTYNSAGNGPWSTPMSFNTIIAGSLGAATLVTPTGSIGTTNNPTYAWNQVTGSTWYQVSVDGPSGNVILQWYSSAQAVCNGTTCAVTPATTLTSGAFTWKVMTYNAAGNGPWSTPMSFSTSNPIVVGAAILVTPTGSIGTNHNPTYTWNQVTGSTWYYLWVNGPSGTLIKQWYTSAQAACNGTTCSVIPSTTLASGAYTWWVETYTSAGNGPWSNAMNFTVGP